MSAPQSYNYSKFVGWGATVAEDINYHSLFNPDRLRIYQTKITELLQGLRKDGRPILVPIETIVNVLTNCYNANKPATGDMFSQFIQEGSQRNDIRTLVDQMINIIVGQIKTEHLVLEQNSKLTIWNTVRGDFNPVGIRSHPPIKVRHRKGESMQFNMHY